MAGVRRGKTEENEEGEERRRRRKRERETNEKAKKVFVVIGAVVLAPFSSLPV